MSEENRSNGGEQPGSEPQRAPKSDSRGLSGFGKAKSSDDEGNADNADSGQKKGGAGGGLKGAAANMGKNKAQEAAESTAAGRAAMRAKETVDKAKKVAEGAKWGAKGLGVVGKIAIAGFPYAHIVYLILIIIFSLIVFGFAADQTIGRNDTRDVCEDPSSARGMVGNLGTGASQTERAQEIGSALASSSFEAFGGSLSVEQIAGLVGNMKQESDVNPLRRQGVNPVETPDTVPNNSEIRSWIGSSGRAIGIIQWDADRAVALVDFAEEQGGQWYDGDIQVQYLASEMNEGYERDQIASNSRLTGNNTPEGYAAEWSNTFFRPGQPHMEARQAGALEFLTYFEGGSHNAARGIVNCGGGGSIGGLPASPEGMECGPTGYSDSVGSAESQLNPNALLGWRCALEAFPAFQEASDQGVPFSLCRPGASFDHGNGNAIDFGLGSGVQSDDLSSPLMWNNSTPASVASRNNDFNAETMDYGIALKDWFAEYDEYFDADYVIFYDRIWNRGSGWAEEAYDTYPGGDSGFSRGTPIRSEDHSYRHVDHVHVSFNGPMNGCPVG